MKVEKIIIGSKNCESITYDSMGDFYKYICDTPINEAFRWARLTSVNGSFSFTQTNSFDEASELLKNGWDDMAQKLTQKLKLIEKDIEPATKRKTIYDVAGYQCSVPRYMNNQPDSMIRTVNVPTKLKVIEITKSVDYSASVDKETIVEQSIKAMQIVKKLENQGYRVNLNIAIGTFNEKGFICKVRVKNANERLNVSKLAFPLVHPSMLRRLFFRFIETYPSITRSFVNGYGSPASTTQLREALGKNEFLIPSVFSKDINSINSLEDL